MVRIAITFVIIAVGCVLVGLIITKIIAAVTKLKDDFDREDRK